MNLFDFGKEKLPSIIKDPFQKTKITRIYVSFDAPMWVNDKEWSANGNVEFKNDDTNGSQKFKATGDDAFDQVTLQIRAFLLTLK